ncbi:MAG TPA: penicillin-binding transpeptidase domain-containing protein [Gammaproteobacteria bacterium]|nr:penicillin-binding transpeptidase domain-containing protein [Gammaproteobacteria bacterium]
MIARSGQPAGQTFQIRARFLLALFAIAALVLLARAVHLQVMTSGYLAGQGEARHLRVAPISAHRGTVTDRSGEPLAVSTPVDSVWVNPAELAASAGRIPRLAAALGADAEWLQRRVAGNLGREFVYVRRHMRPGDAAQVVALGLHGVYLLREYRRYYPAGEVTGHVLGFSNVDDTGQEGLELAFDHWLSGEAGAKRVLKDRLGRSIEDVERIRAPHPGRDLTTSLDLRLQYLAYRELKAAVQHHRARAGSVVILDIGTGEVLAMVNQPSYNPNDRAQYTAALYRNRAATDIFEPGSSLKPMIIAAALESGRFEPGTLVDTGPGYLRIGANTVRDKHNLGRIDVATVLMKSSNVGASMIALALDAEYLWRVLSGFGLGRLTDSGFPGESAGLLSHHGHWRRIGQATLAYGYGLSTTTLQLAQAYAAIGAGGVRRPVSLIRLDRTPGGERVISEATARAVIDMLETVVSDEGTGEEAAVAGYRIAGKTGTAWKHEAGGYSRDRYTSVFAGLAPASEPRLAAVVVLDEPRGGEYYGGDVAAPVFSAVMTDALRLLAVTPDRLPAQPPGIFVQAQESP